MQLGPRAPRPSPSPQKKPIAQTMGFFIRLDSSGVVEVKRGPTHFSRISETDGDGNEAAACASQIPE